VPAFRPRWSRSVSTPANRSRSSQRNTIARQRKSSRSSATRPHGALPERRVPRDACFLDESIDSPEISMTLRNAGANVITFTERFERGTEDEIWLGQIREAAPHWLGHGGDAQRNGKDRG